VQRGFVFDLDRFRGEGGEPVSYLVGYCQPGVAMWACIGKRAKAQVF
jgi:hypothetical protein